MENSLKSKLQDLIIIGIRKLIQLNQEEITVSEKRKVLEKAGDF